MISSQQREIRSFLMGKDQATLAEIYDAVGGNYYANGMKHFGMIMSRMVKRELVIRVKKGVFRLPKEQDLPIWTNSI